MQSFLHDERECNLPILGSSGLDRPAIKLRPYASRRMPFQMNSPFYPDPAFWLARGHERYSQAPADERA
jgi:hypothetical protein